MDDIRFDRVARAVAVEAGTRRTLLRLFAGGTIARLGLSEGAAEKPTRRRRRRAEDKRHGMLHAEGKRKKKRRKPKPKICDPYCVEDGGRCCPGEGCVFGEQCCPGEKACDDGSCVGLRQCCPGETPCDDGSCPAPGRCCPETHQCADGSCVDPFDQCCPDQKRCGNGECTGLDQCCPDEDRPQCSSPCGEVVCEDGELVCRPRNSGETCAGPGTACCKGRCYTANCPPADNGQPRHFNPNTCGCECDVVESCPPGKGWSHSTCSCVCNCAGTCCLSGCCVRGPGNSPYCCQGY